MLQKDFFSSNHPLRLTSIPWLIASLAILIAIGPCGARNQRATVKPVDHCDHKSVKKRSVLLPEGWSLGRAPELSGRQRLRFCSAPQSDWRGPDDTPRCRPPPGRRRSAPSPERPRSPWGDAAYRLLTGEEGWVEITTKTLNYEIIKRVQTHLLQE